MTLIVKDFRCGIVKTKPKYFKVKCDHCNSDADMKVESWDTKHSVGQVITFLCPKCGRKEQLD